MTTVFMTGATGTMGYAGMMEILRYPENYKLKILARPSKKNKELLAPLMEQYKASFLPRTVLAPTYCISCATTWAMATSLATGSSISAHRT